MDTINENYKTDDIFIERLKEMCPRQLLTDEQFALAKQMNKFESIKYINTIFNGGLKLSKIYYDLYVENAK